MQSAIDYGKQLHPEHAGACNTATDYTARFIPHYNGVAMPRSATQILWQR